MRCVCYSAGHRLVRFKKLMQGYGIIQKGEGCVTTIHDPSPVKEGIVLGIGTPGREWTNPSRTTERGVLDPVASLIMKERQTIR